MDSPLRAISQPLVPEALSGGSACSRAQDPITESPDHNRGSHPRAPSEPHGGFVTVTPVMVLLRAPGSAMSTSQDHRVIG